MSKITTRLAGIAGATALVLSASTAPALADDFGTALNYYGARMGLDCGFYKTPVRDHNIYERAKAKADGSGGKQWQSYHWSNCQDVDAVIFDYDSRCVEVSNRYIGFTTYRAKPGHWFRLVEGTSMVIKGNSTTMGCANAPWISSRLHRLT